MIKNYKRVSEVLNKYYKQRTKIGYSFSKYQRIVTGVPQGSILGSSFSIFSLMIYFLVLTNQPYVTTLMIIHFTVRVIMQTMSLISWSRISRKYLNGSMKILWFLIQINAISWLLDFRMPNSIFFMITLQSKNVSEEKILGITIDNKLTFKSHLKNICKKANQKLNALARITKFTSPFQRKTLLNSFIKSQFSYCPLIWMFTSKGLNKKITEFMKNLSD